MRQATATLESISPLSFGRYHDTEKETRGSGTTTESPHDYECRTWKERAHYDHSGSVIIPPIYFKNCLAEIAKYLSLKIPGKRNATYTKHFTAGILVVDPIVLPVTRDTIQGEWLFVPSDGKRGGGSRVKKCFPVIPHWRGEVTFHVLDDVISPDVFEQHLRDAGSFIGIGRFRPANNGYYGRYNVVRVAWTDAAGHSKSHATRRGNASPHEALQVAAG